MSTSDYKSVIDEVSKEEWAEMLQFFNDASIYQTWSYGAVRWGEKNLSHLVLKKRGEVIGLAQLSIKKLPFIKAGIAYLPWGPIWKIHGQELDYKNLTLLIRALKDEYIVKRGLLLRIRPNQFEEDDNKILTIYESEGLKKNFKKPSYRTLVIDLSSSLEELRKNLNQKWRNQLNKAEKNELKIIQGTSDRLYQNFLDLQKEMQTRKKYSPSVDYHEFRLIQDDLPDNLKMNIILCEFNDKPISSAVCSAIGKCGIYLLGATGNEGMKLNGSNLIQWMMIKLLKEQGCTSYDLGGIDPEINPGVYRFKNGLAGKTGKDITHIGEFEECQNLISRLIIMLVEFSRRFI